MPSTPRTTQSLFVSVGSLILFGPTLAVCIALLVYLIYALIVEPLTLLNTLIFSVGFLVMASLTLICGRVCWGEIRNLRQLQQEKHQHIRRGFSVISAADDSSFDCQTPARINRLGEKISALSMRCWRTGWLKGTEFIVPELCRRAIATGMAQPWGKDAIAPDEASDLWALADELKCWVNLDDDDEFEAFDPFPIPAEYLNDIGETDAPGGAGE